MVCLMDILIISIMFIAYIWFNFLKAQLKNILQN